MKRKKKKRKRKSSIAENIRTDRQTLTFVK